MLDQRDSCRCQCEHGYFQFWGLASQPCRPWTNTSCAAGEFLRAGSHDRDAACARCGGCEGKRLIANCTAHANTRCGECGTPRPHGRWEADCTPACEAGHVENSRTGECELCLSLCAAGLRTASPRANCTHCAPCEPLTANARWSAQLDRFECMWECLPGFELGDDPTAACVAMPAAYADAVMQPVAHSKCEAGHTLLDFRCVPCFTAVERGAVSQADLPLAHSLGSSWQWLGGCRWECLNVAGYTALRAENGDYWVCEPATRRSLILQGPDDSWTLAADASGAAGGAEAAEAAVAEAAVAAAPAGRRRMTVEAAPAPAPRRGLAWALLAAVAVPLLLLKCALTLHCLRACRKR